MAERVGFIGLGIMGKPMVRNLVKAGFEVVVHSRTEASVTEMVNELSGVMPAASPTEVARQVKTIITMLPDSPDVTKVVFGENGLSEALGPGHLLIDMSTIAPATAIEVAEACKAKGASALDAPVSGGDKGAIAGTLSIMIGGEASDVERAMPLFEAMGKTIVHVGAAGAGQIVKACNQVVVALNYAAVSEALVLGSKAGVDPANIVKVLSGGLANSRVLEMRGPTMIDHNFQPGFRVNLHRKDLSIALSTGRETGVPLPMTSIVSQFFDALNVAGKGDLDHSALLTFFEGLANHTVGQA
jgi:2-hydroxy-3-oxopropionate reductase